MKNGECRLTNVELRNPNDFYDGRSEASGSQILQRLPSGLEAYGLEAASESDILNLSFDNRHSSFHTQYFSASDLAFFEFQQRPVGVFQPVFLELRFNLNLSRQI